MLTIMLSALIGKKDILPSRAVPCVLITLAKLKTEDFKSEFENDSVSLQ